MKYVKEYLDTKEALARQHADLALAGYRSTQALLQLQLLTYQSERAKANQVLAASAYFRNVLDAPPGNTVLSVKSPPSDKELEASQEPNEKLYRSHCTLPHLTHLS